MSLDECLDDGDVDYGIKVELKIRKVLEEYTDWEFEFNKNGDKYEYDIKFYRWEDDGTGDLEKVHYGFVELERARKWRTGDIPDNWTYYSFLERKVRDYDRALGKWTGPKQNYQRTVYLKFNQLLDNCFAAPVVKIYNLGDRTKRSDGSYNNTYRKLGFDNDAVVTGIEDSVEFIDQFLCNKDSPQQTLLRFAADGGDKA